MITRQDTYKKAFENKTNSLKAKEHQREILLASAYSSEPKLSEIESELCRIGALIATTALSRNHKKLNELKDQLVLLASQKNAILKKCNVPEIVYDCNLCCDTGYVSGKICECIKREAGKILARELSKYMPLDECTFKNFDLKYYKDSSENKNENPKRRMTSIFKTCKEYTLNFNPSSSPNLLFFGSSGLGKTHLTLSIVSEIIEKGFLPVYSSADNLFNIIKNEEFSGEGKGNYDLILNCDLLVIDDLGAEMSTAFTKSTLYNLINTRILYKKPTIINTNLSMKEIEDKYSARVASRLIGNYDAYKFLGDDIRQQKVLNKK